MEFLDEDARPRFLFQSRPQPYSSSQEKIPQNPLKFLLFVSLSISSLLLSLFLFAIESEPFKSLLFWLSLSLLVGPFAPPSLTGGDIRVGVGPIIRDPIDQEPQPEPESKKKYSQRRSKADKVDEPGGNGASLAEDANGFPNLKVKSKDSNGLSKKEDFGNNFEGGEKEWSEADVEMLKKRMGKNPVGKPGRWEAIAAAFNGRHKMESVIKKAKELGEKKVDDADSYAKFLKNRKPFNTRVNDEGDEVTMGNQDSSSGGAVVWNSVEDITLLNALKAFPKDVAMRWEKIAASVPGKSKAACMKRVAELKKDFRSSKACN
ncbi:UMP-CMP kinase-like isoform X1 [Hibiscus syriacus]|uniref:UMP-CMP kinase-like isoform X1 n=1 Tax=Hibiscus syriacus TaxID=106335 RepID=A0A6A3CLQ3_HIBSY|nr:transcription factor MAMYB-like [Hibiscus syriacus]KAE8729637.1 UMP-CMP kinase-like isoform X1 [Hibiscus syriacus]